jgi:hypothetical protein
MAPTSHTLATPYLLVTPVAVQLVSGTRESGQSGPDTALVSWGLSG